MGGCLRHGTQSDAPSLSGVDAADQTPHTEGSSSGRELETGGEKDALLKKDIPVERLVEGIYIR
jgi:hypothetical protein